MQPFLLAPHVFPCVSGQHVVLMDLERDKYVAVVRAHRLADRVRGWPVPAARASGVHNADRDADELIAQMLAHGMLVSDPGLGKPAVPLSLARPERTLLEFEFDSRPRVRATHLLRFARSCLRAQLSLELTPLQSIVQAVRAPRASARTGCLASRPSRSMRIAGCSRMSWFSTTFRTGCASTRPSCSCSARCFRGVDLYFIYLLAQGGWDRAMARRAFYDDLPPEVRNRRHKGGLEEHARRTVEHNRAFLRELLLDGYLVRERIIDRPRLLEVLSGRATRVGAAPGELLEYAGIEAWLRRWEGRGRRGELASPSISMAEG